MDYNKETMPVRIPEQDIYVANQGTQEPLSLLPKIHYTVPFNKQSVVSLHWLYVASLLASLSIVFSGIVGLFLLVFLSSYPDTRLIPAMNFSIFVQLSTFVCIGIIGGTIGTFHAIQALRHVRSRPLTLPPWWIFAFFYAWMLGMAYILQLLGLAVSIPVFSIILILGISIFPAFFWLSFAIHHIEDGFPTTTWRRVLLFLLAGATICVSIALLLEYKLLFLLTGGQIANIGQPCGGIHTPSYCNDPAFSMTLFLFSFIVVPFLEELIKPLPLLLFMKKVSTGAEAFILGLACGLGFDMVETAGYIGGGYTVWANVAFERLGTSLLHGFGTAALSLGCFYLIQGGADQTLKVIVCWVYALVQHIVWNGTAGLSLLPAPFGAYIKTLLIHVGPATIPLTDGVNLLEAVLYFQVFVFALRSVKQEHSEVIVLT
jgi:RsiW-degrading membrane proteinase PrsW (M82 family)